MSFYFKSSAFSIWNLRRLLSYLGPLLQLHVAEWLWNTSLHVFAYSYFRLYINFLRCHVNVSFPFTSWLNSAFGLFNTYLRRYLTSTILLYTFLLHIPTSIYSKLMPQKPLEAIPEHFQLNWNSHPHLYVARSVPFKSRPTSPKCNDYKMCRNKYFKVHSPK